jgi:ComF family protein
VSLFARLFSRSGADRLIDHFAARSACAFCEARLASHLRASHIPPVCEPCLGDLPWQQGNNYCIQCAIKIGSGATHCGPCLRRPPAFDQTVAAFNYAFPIDQVIQRLKYGHDLTLAHVLSASFSHSFNIRPLAQAPDVIVVTPVTRQRLIERGFNQATQIAKPIARSLSIRLEPLWLERVKDTTPQAQLPWKERRKNIKGAFALAAREAAVEGKHIAVVDDVLTTGATMNEIAKVLKDAGAASVEAWVIARTQPRPMGERSLKL